MADAKHDNNRIPTLLAVSNVDSSTPVVLEADPTTKRLLVDTSSSGGGTSMTDDAAFTPGTTSVTPVGAMFDDVTPDSVNEGDGGVVRMSANRNLYTTLRDAAGNERGANVDASNQLSVVDSAVKTAVELIDDTVATLGTTTYTEATSKGITIGAVRRDADTTLVDTTNEFSPLQVDANGRLKVEAFSGETLPVSLTSTTVTGTVAVTQSGTWDEVGINDSGNSITVDQATGSNLHTVVDSGTITTVSSVTAIANALPAGTNAIGKLAANSGVDIGDVDILSIAAGDNNIGNVDIQTVPVNAVADGDAISNSTNRLVSAASGSTPVTVSTHSKVFNGTTWDRQRGDTNGTYTIGNVAHDAADAGNPVKLGAKAETALSAITLVVDGDRTDLYAGVDGVLITRPHCNLEDLVSGNASNTDGTSTQVIAASGSGIKTYLTDITITNTSSSNIYVELKDNTTVKWTLPVPANGGVTHNFTVPLAGSANVAWNFDPSAATTTVYCSAAGFKSKV